MAITLGHDIWKWPEFKALMDRLGVNWHQPVKDMVIQIPVHGLVQVTFCQLCTDMGSHVDDALNSWFQGQPRKVEQEVEADVSIMVTDATPRTG